eukprot:m.163238 g.163238  ORF g.163238 m.163238 type:complete len:56 (-) comp12283_c0_seq1:87-254(-)
MRTAGVHVSGVMRVRKLHVCVCVIDDTVWLLNNHQCGVWKPTRVVPRLVTPLNYA